MLKDSSEKGKLCRLCGRLLREGNPNNEYGKTTLGREHISRHHLFPRRKRFRDLFTESEIQEMFGIDRLSTKLDFCYACHEEMLHNIIFNKAMIDSLAFLFQSKGEKDRIKIMHKIVAIGIKEYLKRPQKQK